MKKEDCYVGQRVVYYGLTATVRKLEPAAAARFGDIQIECDDGRSGGGDDGLWMCFAKDCEPAPAEKPAAAKTPYYALIAACPDALKEAAEAFARGAPKHGDSWRRLDSEHFIDKAVRHIIEDARVGEQNTADGGTHLAAAITDLLLALQLRNGG